MALLTRSQAILLDGLYSFITLIMPSRSLKVVEMVQRPQTPRYPFGFTAFEPFLKWAKSLNLLAMWLIFLATNMLDLLRGGREIALELTIIYLGICLLIYGAVILILRRCIRQARSSILAFETKNRTIDALLTLGIAISILAARDALRLDQTEILPYIAPVIVIALCLLSLPVPLQTFARERQQMLLASGENVAEMEVRCCLAGVIEKYGLLHLPVWSLQSGRVRYLFL